MDPNAALKLLRELRYSIVQNLDSESPDEDELMEKASEMADAFEGLDQWLTKGGFLPHEWTHGR